jgi:hypothetical protein
VATRFPVSYKSGMSLRYYWPLLGFVLPSAGIGFGFVIPQSCIAGVNELTVGFALTIVGAAATYVMGVRMALRESRGK